MSPTVGDPEAKAETIGRSFDVTAIAVQLSDCAVGSRSVNASGNTRCGWSERMEFDSHAEEIQRAGHGRSAGDCPVVEPEIDHGCSNAGAIVPTPDVHRGTEMFRRRHTFRTERRDSMRLSDLGHA